MRKLQLQDSDNKDSDKEVYENEDDKPRLRQAREESKLKDEIIYRILNGKAHTMKPNSREAVQIHESYISLKCYTEEEGEYLVWEWHGHIMGFTIEGRFAPEYIYGNYFQKIVFEEPPCA